MTDFRAAEVGLTSFLEGLRGVVPGGVALVAADDEVIYERPFGLRSLVPTREDASADTLYDLASLTKPLVTASCLLVLRRQGLDFDAPVTGLVPELGGGPAHRPPTIGELLLHAGGLPSWEPLYAAAPGGMPERARWLASRRQAPGLESVYGCPGYQVLGLAVERAAGEPLATFASRTLWEDREDLFFPLPARLAGRAAPTETGNAFEREMAGERAQGYGGFRTDVIRGETHDHNAFTAGGAAGNAGLFGTARGVFHLARRFLAPGRLFDERDLGELARDLSPPSGSERRTWGFQHGTTPGSPAGDALGKRSFGHTGFTGTSVMVDPDRSAVYVLLTNRIHPRFVERAFNADRRAFHERAARLVDARHAGAARG